MSRRIEWRFYDDTRDRDPVHALHHELEAKVGRRLDLPELSARPVLATVVGETGGKLSHGVFIEAEAEVCAIGPNPLPAREADGAAALLLPVLKYYDIRLVRCFVPSSMLAPNAKGRPAPLARLLKRMQFADDTGNYNSFFRWLEREG